MEWIKVTDRLPQPGIEVICFNPAWIDEDFNPNGTRCGFLNGDKETFTTAYYWAYQDCYMTISREECEGSSSYSDHIKDNTEPTYWCEIPSTKYNHIVPQQQN